MQLHPGSAALVWSGPPRDLVPGATAAGVILGRGPHVVVGLNPLRCYLSGLDLSVAVRAGVRVPGLYEKVVGRRHAGGRVAHPLLLSIRLADGTTLSSAFLSDGEPGPTLTARSSEGTDDAVDAAYWLAPLPLSGPLTVVCSWPEHGIVETTTELDVDEIRTAAERSLPLLSDGY